MSISEFLVRQEFSKKNGLIKTTYKTFIDESTCHQGNIQLLEVLSCFVLGGFLLMISAMMASRDRPLKPVRQSPQIHAGVQGKQSGGVPDDDEWPRL